MTPTASCPGWFLILPVIMRCLFHVMSEPWSINLVIALWRKQCCKSCCWSCHTTFFWFRQNRWLGHVFQASYLLQVLMIFRFTLRLCCRFFLVVMQMFTRHSPRGILLNVCEILPCRKVLSEVTNMNITQGVCDSCFLPQSFSRVSCL